MSSLFGWCLRTVMLAVLVAGCGALHGVELNGTVEYVKELEVWIRMDSTLVPEPGDLVELSFTIPTGERLTVGRWQVGAVQDTLVWATVIESTGRPAVGQQARIVSAEARPAAAPKATPTPQATTLPTPRPTPPPVAPPPGASARLLIELRQGDAGQRRVAARVLYQNHRTEAAVQEAANEVLIAGFDQKSRDAEHVDAMAYLCKILGESGIPDYETTLRAVAKTSPSPKLRKYGSANLDRLRRDAARR